MKEHNVSHLLVPHRYSRTLYVWAKSEHITLIGPPPTQQKNLENKLYFDSLLKKYTLPSPPTIQIDTLKQEKMYVVQSASSYGMFGTRFMKGSEIDESVKNNSYNYLVREYIDGKSYGITTVISQDGSYILSAIRRQCFTYENNMPTTFVGVQWVATNEMKDKVRKSLEDIMRRLIQHLRELGFYGMANFDFLISEDNVYILECNPRLSSATPQLFGPNGVISIENSWLFFLHAHENNDTVASFKQIPSSHYTGALMDIDVLATKKVITVPQVGVYQWTNNKMIYVSDMFSDCNQPDRFFLIHQLSPTTKRFGHDTFCTIISHTSLFNSESGERNTLGQHITDYILNTCLK
jgi:hypothetical protein